MIKKAIKSAKPRNAEATREAILASARRLFARSGYDGAGVREIAAGAGVTAMLVNRYFGSKENLFAEAISASMREPVILSAKNLESADFANAMAKALIAITDARDSPLEGFQILLRSAGSQEAAIIGRETIESGHQKTMSNALTGDLAPQRAAILLSLVGGFQMMRQMIALSDLTSANPEDLLRIIEPVIRMLVNPIEPGQQTS